MRKQRIGYLGTALVMGLLVLSGCGVWKKYSANSAIKKVKESLAVAQQEEADRYANDLYSEAQSLIAQAESDVEAGDYQEALNKVNEAEKKVSLSKTQVPKNRRIIEGKRAELNQLEGDIQDDLAKAEASPSRAVAETEITPPPPSARMGNVIPSSPEITEKSSSIVPSMISETWDMLPLASLMPTIPGWRASSQTTSGVIFCPVRPGTLYITTGMSSSASRV